MLLLIVAENFSYKRGRVGDTRRVVIFPPKLHFKKIQFNEMLVQIIVENSNFSIRSLFGERAEIF